MTGPTILESRFTAVWVKAFLPQGRLSSRTSYEQAVDQARGRKHERVRGDHGWLLPWPEQPRQNFWQYYLEANSLAVVEPKRAWTHLMPLSVPPLAAAHPEKTGKPAQGKGRGRQQCSVEGFCFPTGVAAAITVRVREGLALDATVDRLTALRQSRFEVEWADRTLAPPTTLDDLAAAVLARLCDACGVKLDSPSPPAPVTIAGIIEAVGADAMAPVAADSDLYAALAALTRLKPGWRKAKLPPPEQALLALGREPNPGDTLVASESGRALWLPTHFRDQPREVHKEESERGKKLLRLGRYHRNLTMATMQTAYLLSFLDLAAWALPIGKLGLDGQDLARHAAGVVGRLFGRTQKSYKTRSVRAQIERFRSPVDKVRTHFGMQPLH